MGKAPSDSSCKNHATFDWVNPVFESIIPLQTVKSSDPSSLDDGGMGVRGREQQSRNH